MTIAYVFPGQGAQVVGMGRELAAHYPAARAIFAQADATMDYALSDLCFAGPEAELMATEHAQPALLATGIAALAAVAGDTDVAAWVATEVACVAGHSLGEYTALVAAGAIDLQSALRLVRRRGELMAAARGGAMAAVIGLHADALDAVCLAASDASSQVVVANYNAPGQLVISGDAAAVERASVLARNVGAKRVLALKVSAAFHSPLMAEAAAGLRATINSTAIGDARVPVIANVSGAPIQRAAEIRAELAAQVTAPVRWIASVEHMAARGTTRVIEFGPGTVLTGLVRRIAPEIACYNVADPAGVAHTLASVLPEPA